MAVTVAEGHSHNVTLVTIVIHTWKVEISGSILVTADIIGVGFNHVQTW